MASGKSKKYRALILCCGRMDRGDDAIGPLCAAALEERRVPARVLSGEASELLDAWQVAEKVIVVDAMATGRASPGTVHRFDAAEPGSPFETGGYRPRGPALAQATKLGRVLKCLPPTLILIGLEAESFDWAATLSPAVAEGMAALVEAVEQEWRRLASVVPARPMRYSAAQDNPPPAAE